MKKIFFLIAAVLLLSCDKDNDNNNNNPYLPNYPVNVQLNKSLPEYDNLNYVANPVYVNIAGVGIRGLIVMKTGEGSYAAFDRACPNQNLSSCSTMTINGINAKCPCDDKEYSLFTGLPTTQAQYPMKQYRAQLNGNYVIVTN
ncbi:hypothetical protein ABGT15_00435 [Flavobacterium enshiense]|uniref:hypothetical protein n=1 Tax=Flavobacterium enshiense TaxID=1341165 RepID=UPI00345CD480